MYIVGIDTGGTKTKCILVNSEYDLLGVGESGPGNYHVAGVNQARENIVRAIREALREGGIDETERIIGGFGMGTLDTESDYEIISGFLDEIEFIDRKFIENDVVIAHYAMTAGAPGVTVVAGTGAMAYGTNASGGNCRSSGWGWLIGDEGSGYYSAKRGIQAAAKAYDGRGPRTALLNASMDHFDVDEFEDVLPTIHNKLDHPKKIAAFAKPLTEIAEQGDSVALGIIEEAGEELASAAVAVIENLELTEPVQVGCVGGFGTSPLVTATFRSVLSDEITDIEFLEQVDHPVVGTLAFVTERLGDDVEKSTLLCLDDEIETAERNHLDM